MVIFLGSFIFLLLAAIIYVPLLCYIQGNLKEYCCHKTDKVRSCRAEPADLLAKLGLSRSGSPS